MPDLYEPLMLFTGRASYYLGTKLRDALAEYPGMEGLQLYEPEVIRFANENLKVKITESVRGADVFLVQTAANAHHAPAGVNPERVGPEQARTLTLSENLMELLITIDALQGASAGRITVVAPYFPYVRSDKKDEPRISITARLMSQLFREAGAERVLTVNLHAMQIMGFMGMACDQLDANPLIAEFFKQNYDVSKLGVLATDAGGVKIGTVYAERLNVPLAVCDKRRWADNEDPEIRSVIGIEAIKDREIAIFDDEILTGGTMTRAIRALQEKFGLPASYVCCVHPVFAGDAMERIVDSGVERVVTTDTLPPPQADHRVSTVSVAPLLAAAINNIHTNLSVSQIFRNQENALFEPEAGPR
ncbi:MAG: ribose-phosphate pyrophosphokinase [Candidatus Brocadiaceae bacterium]|jgi:ribose-phosphate pyrophosphokinase